MINGFHTFKSVLFERPKMFRKLVRRVVDLNTPPTYLGDYERVSDAQGVPLPPASFGEDTENRPARPPAKLMRSLWRWARVGLIVLGVIVVIAMLYKQEWWLIKRVGYMLFHLATVWAPAHPRYAAAIVGFFLVSFGLNYLAHKYGRSRLTIGRAKLWVTLNVILFFGWFVFWYWPVVIVFRNVLGKDTSSMSFHDILLSDLLIISIMSAYFWIAEKLEDFRRNKVISESKF